MPKPIRNSWLPSALMRYKVDPRPEGGDMTIQRPSGDQSRASAPSSGGLPGNALVGSVRPHGQERLVGGDQDPPPLRCPRQDDAGLIAQPDEVSPIRVHDVPYQRKFALHEMAHAWTEANVDAEVLDRFMDVRGIAAWNDRTFDWKQRGTEQVAEIITWGLGEGEIAPLLPEITDPETLARLYRLLTARDPITSAAR